MADEAKPRRLIASVWDCGDDSCGCSQATIIIRGPNEYGHDVPLDTVWEGEFITDHESGAEDELERVREAMQETWPEMADLIEWVL